MRNHSLLSMYATLCLASIMWCLSANAQSGAALNPWELVRLEKGIRDSAASARAALAAPAAMLDPLSAKHVLDMADKVFPNLAADARSAELLQRVVADPGMRGNLRGQIAEADWINRNGKNGWKRVASRNAPQNDAFRFVNGKPEGAQVKVHADWREYLRSMNRDNKAERFVLPDDHFEKVFRDLEIRKQGALRGGEAAKAAEYARQQQRLTKMGRSFQELDNAVGAAAKHCRRIAAAIKAAGKAASFITIGMMILDGGIAVYEVAEGKAGIDELMTRLGKIAGGGIVSWWAANAASSAAIAAGSTGAAPVVVAIVVGAAVYLVVDWAVDTIADSVKAAHLTRGDVELINRMSISPRQMVKWRRSSVQA